MLENLLNERNKKSTKPEMEQVEKEKQEYKLIGTYLRRRGLKLFSYNSLKDELKEINISKGNTIHLIHNEDGVLMPKDFELEKAVVDARNIHFEALNLKSAKKRLFNYKQGKIKELCNLRVAGKSINFW